ncbi:hypothetical protein OsI_17793 [Oryza sativa Indica Group]|uniref:Repressor of RNA polymerase III transcription n=2 Tax=Oryza sativa TaxID=4530 RepID=B9FCZ3_ORYSJ|nr:hypothetical protein OsI_17793 [Oryza sativa Indica Group]EEE61848.1 hypothetical protein OsJ_16513 [Oryza sativa Japonica Group]
MAVLVGVLLDVSFLSFGWWVHLQTLQFSHLRPRGGGGGDEARRGDPRHSLTLRSGGRFAAGDAVFSVNSGERLPRSDLHVADVAELLISPSRDTSDIAVLFMSSQDTQHEVFRIHPLRQILDCLSKSSDSDHSSPVEHLSCRSSRKTLIYLVLTLSHMYPDYDFSAVRAHLFFKEEEWESFKEMTDTYLSEASKQWAATNEGTSLLDSMTNVIDEVIKIGESDIYSYNPDQDGDPFLEKGVIWSINFFFYNRKLKRVVSFRCSCISKISGDDFLTSAPSDGEEEDALIDMDI